MSIRDTLLQQCHMADDMPLRYAAPCRRDVMPRETASHTDIIATTIMSCLLYAIYFRCCRDTERIARQRMPTLRCMRYAARRVMMLPAIRAAIMARAPSAPRRIKARGVKRRVRMLCALLIIRRDAMLRA